MSENRVPLTVRIKPATRVRFHEACAPYAIEPAIAARQILEMVLASLQPGEGYVNMLARLEAALKPRIRVQAGRAP